MSYIGKYVRGIIQNTKMDPFIPENISLIQMYALLAKVKGKDTTREDVHDAWSIWMEQLNPYHVSIAPFDKLTDTVQAYDQPYVDAIHKVAEGEEG